MVKGKTIRDEILIHIWEGLNDGLQNVSLHPWIEKHSQVIATADNLGLLEHKGNGNFVLTQTGLSWLIRNYPALFKSDEVEFSDDPEDLAALYHPDGD